MGKFYLIRHAESVANSRGIYQGQTYDTQLSLRGKKQAKNLAIYFKNLKLDCVVASPLKRTSKTAEYLAKATNSDLLHEPLIIETNHGDWEGKHKDFIQKNWSEIYGTWFKSPADAVFPNGESFKATQKRVLDWWKDFKKTPGEFAVVTHDNIIRIIVAHTLGLSLNKIWNFDITPTGVTVIEQKHDDSKLRILNDTKHLNGEEKSVTAHAL